jgi:transcriptional regulator with XRE-family HTH domain
MKTTVAIMNLKEKILQVLEMKKFTYADLASYLNISESELDFALENNTLEIRTLELISKELRIPLYSFFRENFEGFNFEKEPYYNVNIWSSEESKYTLELKALRQEIEILRTEIRQKDLLIDALEDQITKGK